MGSRAWHRAMTVAAALIVAVMLIGAVTGCATVGAQPETLEQRAYAAVSDYTTVLNLAAVYCERPTSYAYTCLRIDNLAAQSQASVDALLVALETGDAEAQIDLTAVLRAVLGAIRAELHQAATEELRDGP